MLKFIFSPDWYLWGLLLSLIHALISILFDISKDEIEAENIFWTHVSVLIVAPIFVPIVIIIDIVSNTKLEELKNDFLKVFSFKDKSKSKNDTHKEYTQNKNKKAIIENKIQEIISLFTSKKFYAIEDKSYHNRIGIEMGYIDEIRIERYKNNYTKYAVESLGSISLITFKYAENKDYVRISNSLRDILISLIEFYSSVINDEFMKDSEINDLINSFYDKAYSIASELIGDEKVRVNDIKKKEAEEERKRIEELAKFSYEKFSNAKDSMLESLDIGARIKKKQ